MIQSWHYFLQRRRTLEEGTRICLMNPLYKRASLWEGWSERMSWVSQKEELWFAECECCVLRHRDGDCDGGSVSPSVDDYGARSEFILCFIHSWLMAVNSVSTLGIMIFTFSNHRGRITDIFTSHFRCSTYIFTIIGDQFY